MCRYVFCGRDCEVEIGLVVYEDKETEETEETKAFGQCLDCELKTEIKGASIILRVYA